MRAQETRQKGDACVDGVLRTEYERFSNVARIAVLRGGGIGDLVMAMPAIDSLAEAYPTAEITLLGMPSHAEILHNRQTCISRVAVLPCAEGIRNGVPDLAAQARFTQSLRRQKLDLVVQLHGGGRFSNPFVAQLGGTHTVGSRSPDAQPLERTVHHQYFQHEVLRGLEVAGLAGASKASHRLQWGATEDERARARALLPEHWQERALVLMHPGARDPRRRWPAASFAAVAAALVHAGSEVVVVGDGQEGDLVHEVVHLGRGLLGSAAAQRHLLPLAGSMHLGVLCGMLSLSQVLVANDSGPRHVAESLGVPTASIYWAPNVVNAGPWFRAQHRVQIAWDTRCPVCSAEAAAQTIPACGHEKSFVTGVAVRDVLADVLDLLRR